MKQNLGMLAYAMLYNEYHRLRRRESTALNQVATKRSISALPGMTSSMSCLVYPGDVLNVMSMGVIELAEKGEASSDSD